MIVFSFLFRAHFKNIYIFIRHYGKTKFQWRLHFPTAAVTGHSTDGSSFLRTTYSQAVVLKTDSQSSGKTCGMEYLQWTVNTVIRGKGQIKGSGICSRVCAYVEQHEKQVQLMQLLIHEDPTACQLPSALSRQWVASAGATRTDSSQNCNKFKLFIKT